MSRLVHVFSSLTTAKCLRSSKCLWTTIILGNKAIPAFLTWMTLMDELELVQFTLNIYIYMGYKNLNKAPAPHVISIAEESIAKSRRPHACTVRPRQWHIARGGPTAAKKL